MYEGPLIIILSLVLFGLTVIPTLYEQKKDSIVTDFTKEEQNLLDFIKSEVTIENFDQKLELNQSNFYYYKIELRKENLSFQINFNWELTSCVISNGHAIPTSFEFKTKLLNHFKDLRKTIEKIKEDKNEKSKKETREKFFSNFK